MNKAISKYSKKILYGWTSLLYPGLRKELRMMVRDNYYCRLLQLKFLHKDYVSKTPYKVIFFEGEFDQELRYVLPFAYWHYLNGTLKKTISSKGTKELYFFSPQHEEKFTERNWKASFQSFHIPNMTHSNQYSFAKWKQVPLKQYYRNDIFKYEKPLLIIANKYNTEWNQPPINFFDIGTLNEIITACKKDYQIVYNRPQPGNIVGDNSEILQLHEHSWLQDYHPDVLLMEDLFVQNRQLVNNFNHLQLMVYANAEAFVSVHGGTAAFASYFGGTNIILSDPAWGREHPLQEFKNLFPKLSGAKIVHAHNRKQVIKYVQQYFLQSKHELSGKYHAAWVDLCLLKVLY